MTKFILAHPTGNQNVRAALTALLGKDLLCRFYTTIAVFPKSLLFYISKLKKFNHFQRRYYLPNLAYLTKKYPLRETGRIISQKFGFTFLTKGEKSLFSRESVYKSFDIYTSKKIAYEKNATDIYLSPNGGSVIQTIKKSKEQGIRVNYELVIGYWRAAKQILEAEIEKRPEWRDTIPLLSNSKQRLDELDEELQLADRIIVASSFTAETLKLHPLKIASSIIIPYGYPSLGKAPEKNYPSNITKTKKLKLLYVGALTQRKGIADIFESLQGIEEYVDLTLVGHLLTNNCKTLNNYLSRHNWIKALNNDQVLDLMQKSDVLIFPSLFEGFGLVITESMSRGTPVITTNRTAGADLIRNNENGWIVDASSPLSINNCLQTIIETPNSLRDTGNSAYKASTLRPWEKYGQELCEFLTQE